MATNPRNIFKSFERMDRERRDDDLVRYQFKVVRTLKDVLSLDMVFIKQEFERLRYDRPEMFMEAVKGDRSGCLPPGFFVEKGGRTLFADLAAKAHETKWFERFKELASAGGLEPTALIFPVLGRKDFIMHNMPVTAKVGVTRLVIPSGVVEVDDVHITPLAQFIEEYGGIDL